MSTHTPGPWQCVSGETGLPCGSATRHDLVILGDNGYGLSICWLPARADAHLQAEQEANARLIAAAPDLLAALKTVTNTLAYLQGEGWENVKSARTAIAKAETPHD